MDRRKTILRDKRVDDELLMRFAFKIYSDLKDINHFTQMDIVKSGLKLKLGNKTIARLINNMIAGSKATENSVGVIVARIKREQEEYLDLLRRFEGYV